jgi:hypothetical protein
MLPSKIKKFARRIFPPAKMKIVKHYLPVDEKNCVGLAPSASSF